MKLVKKSYFLNLSIEDINLIFQRFKYDDFLIRLQTFGERIFLSDISDSIHVVRYRSKEGTFYEIADDVLPRWISSVCLLDYSTICAADKFENFFVLRLP